MCLQLFFNEVPAYHDNRSKYSSAYSDFFRCNFSFIILMTFVAIPTVQNQVAIFYTNPLTNPMVTFAPPRNPEADPDPNRYFFLPGAQFPSPAADA